MSEKQREEKQREIEPSIWQIMVQPMIVEYQVLWTEMNNRWTQQQSIINISWTILALFVAINQFFLQYSINLNFSQSAVVELILLIPLSLSILCLIFLRNDDKNWRIIAYIYSELRPNIQKIYTRMYEYYKFNGDSMLSILPSRIWNWGSYEMDKAFEKKWKEILVHPLLDISRYALMVIPAWIVIIQAHLKFWTIIISNTLTFSLLALDWFLAILSIVYCIIIVTEFRTLLGTLRRRKAVKFPNHY